RRDVAQEFVVHGVSPAAWLACAAECWTPGVPAVREGAVARCEALSLSMFTTETLSPCVSGQSPGIFARPCEAAEDGASGGGAARNGGREQAGRGAARNGGGPGP